ncbi:MAG: S-layer homology domain-containing protein [Oscillospiraceae bacterium]|jgi:hypothetical protein|nr:S-layer homology domain-containing protein [Oscillospiraceae bacterium]
MRMQKLKRSLALVLSLVLVIGLFPVTGLAAETSKFTDIPSWDTSGAVDYLASKGLVSGINEAGTLFGHTNKLTKKGYFTFIDKFLGFSKGDKVALSHFTDVKGIGEPYESAIAALAYQGIITATTVNPNSTVTRELAFTTLAKVLGLTENKAALSRVNDGAKVSDWAQGWVGALIAKGFAGGDANKNINPQSEFTRGGMAVLLNNVFGAYINAAGKSDYAGKTVESLTISEPNALVKNVHVTGDLIIAASVLDGDVYLEDVTVDGTLIAFGGGSHSVKIQGKSSINHAVAAKQSANSQPVHFAVADGAKFGSFSVNPGVHASLTGHADTVKLDAGSQLDLSAATVAKVELAGAEAKLSATNSKVDAIAVDKEAVESSVTLEKSVVKELSTDAAGSKLSATNSAIVTVTITVNATKTDTNLGSGTTIGTITITATLTTTEVNAAATIATFVAEVAAVLDAAGKVGSVEGAAATEVTDAAGATVDAAALAEHDGSGETIEEAEAAVEAVVEAAEAEAQAEVAEVNPEAQVAVEADTGAEGDEPAAEPTTPSGNTPSGGGVSDYVPDPTNVISGYWSTQVGGLTLVTVTLSNPTSNVVVTVNGYNAGSSVAADSDVAVKQTGSAAGQWRAVLVGNYIFTNNATSNNSITIAIS